MILKPTDLASIQKLPDMAAQLLRQAGFKVELQPMDWQSVVARRAKKDPADKGGWHMVLTGAQGFDMSNPISNPMLDTRGEKATGFGWPSDDKIQAGWRRSDEEEVGRADAGARLRGGHARTAGRG